MHLLLRISSLIVIVSGLNAEPIKANCSFSESNRNQRCDVRDDLKIYFESQEIIIENGMNFTNTTTFVVEQKDVPYFPQRIDKHFPNLKALQITTSNLRKITQKDLQNFTYLEHLDLCYNNIEILEENLFKFNKNLFKIYFNNNKIKEIDPTAFDGPTAIMNLGLSGNICYSSSFNNIVDIRLIIENLKTKCWSESLAIKKFILRITKEDTGIEILQKILNFKYDDLTKQSSHPNASSKCDLKVYDTANMICIFNSSNYEPKIGVLYSEALFGMSLMDVLVIINTMLLVIIAATILALKCTSKFQNNPRPQTPVDVHNKIYEEIQKPSNFFPISKLSRSMEILEKNYHENDGNYDEISGAVLKEKYSAVVNAEDVEVVYSDNQELYSEVGNLNKVEEINTTDVGVEKPEEEIIYTEVIKRSSGWI